MPQVQPSASLEPTTCKESEPFALQVLDDSMAPELWPGCVVVIDPTGVVADGAYVLAEHAGGFLIRAYRCAEGVSSLRPLNADYATVEVDATTTIHGVVVQRAGSRRKHHKRYDLTRP